MRVADASPEEAAAVEETELGALDDMLAFAVKCERMAGELDAEEDIATDGVWPEVPFVEETVILGTPVITVVNL